MSDLLTSFEFWLFSLLVRNGFVSVKAMDLWIERLGAKDGPLSKTTIFINPDLWDAQIRHPDLKRLNTIGQLCKALDLAPGRDVVFLGPMDDVARRSLRVSGARLVVENALVDSIQHSLG